MKVSKSERVFSFFNTLFMILLIIAVIFPYLNQLATSLNEGADAMKGGIWIWPRKFTLDNYTAVLHNSSFVTSVVVSILRVLIGTLLSVIVTYFAAYGLTRRNVKGRREITLFLMIPSYISAGTIPLYIAFRYFGLINSFWVYILPFTFSFYNMVIMRSFLQSIPDSLEEAAKIDGANDFMIMCRIYLPLSMPAIACVALWNAVFHWNDWTTTLLYVTDKNLFPMQYVLMRLIKESSVAQQMAQEASMHGESVSVNVTPDTVKAATLMVSTLPIIMTYPFLQKYFIKGVTLGSVKE